MIDPLIERHIVWGDLYNGETSFIRFFYFSVFFYFRFCGMVLEIIWTRLLGVTFGNTVFAASTVLTAFMLGLALGSAVFGKLVDRFHGRYGFMDVWKLELEYSRFCFRFWIAW